MINNKLKVKLIATVLLFFIYKVYFAGIGVYIYIVVLLLPRCVQVESSSIKADLILGLTTSEADTCKLRKYKTFCLVVHERVIFYM